MDPRLKSYKLSSQLRAELNFSSSKKKLPQIKFNIKWKNIDYKKIALTLFAGAIIIFGYVGVKKGYEGMQTRAEAKRVAQENEYGNHLAQIKTEVKAQATDAYAYANLSKKYLKDKDIERAEAAALLATETDPKWADGFVNLGLVYMSENKFDQAKVALNNGLKVDPLSGEGHYLLSLTYEELKSPDLAKQELAKAKTFGFDTEFGG